MDPRAAIDIVYVILFHAHPGERFPPPIVRLNAGPVDLGTAPHGFARELIPILKALWYCLHLPRTQADTRMLDASALGSLRHFEFPHDIMPMPIDWAREAIQDGKLRSGPMCFILCPDDALDVAQAIQAATGSPLAPVLFSSLSPASLTQHWAAIDAARSQGREGAKPTPPVPFVQELALGQLLLPSLFSARLLGVPEHMLERPFASREQAREFALDTYALCFGRVDEGKASESTPEYHRVPVPLVLTAPGVPERYQRLAFGRTEGKKSERASTLHWDQLDNLSDESEIEAAVISTLVTHRAIGANGVGFQMRDMVDGNFRLLGELETHYTESRPKPKYVWRTLKKLGERLAEALGPEGQELVRSASSIMAFTDFPVGLAILPGDTAPISCRMPVTQLPLTPLTRALQRELVTLPTVYLKDGFRLLIAECLEDGDPIKSISRGAWSMLKQSLSTMPGMHCEIIEFRSERQLREELKRNHYDVLLLSAHGTYARSSNVAGIRIGDELSLGLELGDVPPIVLLSACHTNPRGIGAVSIADLLLRQGAVAVLGTLVPVNVFRNAILIMRLFTYIQECLAGRAHLRSLDRIWHHVASTNVIAEISASSEFLERWTTGPFQDRTVLDEFMMRRSVHVRPNHRYEDTERLLAEIADESGVGHRFRESIKSQSYFPESLFYTMLGRPDRIVFNDHRLDDIRSVLGDEQPT